MFAFSGPAARIAGVGAGRAVPRGPAATLQARLSGAGGVIGGALPFRREDDDYLWQARCVRDDAAAPHPAAPDPAAPDLPAPHPAAPVAIRQVRAQPSPALYASSVAHALRLMDRGEGAEPLSKVVLARTLAVEADGPIPQDQVFRRIAQDRSVTAFRVLLPQGQDHAPWTGRALIGATPELLAAKDGAAITSHPLAGSARRQADPAADRAAREALAASDKDRREHAIVVEYILDRLAPLCRDLGCPEGTAITATATMWHLGTRIAGTLRDPSMPSVLLASMLHPTPAVCGLPCGRAASVIAQLEPVDRQFYAGAVGWCDMDRQGDGAWFVAIRCADICGPHARLFAGAGIVAGSDPVSETEETGAKFGAMLRILGLPADAGMPAANTEF